MITIGGATAQAWIDSGALDLYADPAGTLVGETRYNGTNGSLFNATNRDLRVPGLGPWDGLYGIGVFTQEARGLDETTSIPQEIGYYQTIGEGDRLRVDVNKEFIGGPGLVNAEVMVSYLYAEENTVPEQLSYVTYRDGVASAPVTVTASGNGRFSSTNPGFFTFELPDDLVFDRIDFIGAPYAAEGGRDASDYLVEKITGDVYTPPPPGGDPLPEDIVIDVKPGSNPSAFNLGAGGVLPVAIFTTEDFDVTQIDTGSLRLDDNEDDLLAGGGVAPIRFSYEDVDGDGDIDLAVKWRMSDVRTVVAADAVDIFVYGLTTGGQEFIGTNPEDDPIKIVTAGNNR